MCRKLQKEPMHMQCELTAEAPTTEASSFYQAWNSLGVNFDTSISRARRSLCVSISLSQPKVTHKSDWAKNALRQSALNNRANGGRCSLQSGDASLERKLAPAAQRAVLNAAARGTGFPTSPIHSMDIRPRLCHSLCSLH